MRVDSDDELDKEYDMLDSDLDDDELNTRADDTPASTAPSTPRPKPASDPLTDTIPSDKLPRCRQKIHKCTFEDCDKVFDRKVRLEDHIRSHNNERNFKCPHPPCTKAFLRDSHLKHHIKNQHTDIRDYQCTWEGCDASFTTGTRLRRHLATHEAKEQFRCRGYSGCDQTFRKQETLDRHILSVHQNVKPFPCKEEDPVTGETCTKAYDTAENLRSHIRAKHDATRFSCEECLARNADILANSDGQDDREVVQATFPTYGGFQAHLDKHHPPTCQFCPTSFITNKELTRHLEVQHAILPEKSNQSAVFTCTFEGCGKKFSKKGNLSVHVKTVHENKRDFVCGKTEITLPEEITNQPNVVVHGCNRSFTSKASLEEHVRTAHLDLPSKRMIRDKKRKADHQADDDEETYAPAAGGGVQLKKQKQRKPRSDKGVPRSSAMTGITGIGAPSIPTIPVAAALSQSSAYQPGFAANLVMPMDMDEETSTGTGNAKNKGTPTLLSSSMVICDDRIYHYGSSYHYPSGEYPTLLSRDLARTSMHDNDLHTNDPYGSGNSAGFGTNALDDYEDVNFFGQFEQEQEAEKAREQRGYAYPAL